MQELEEVDNEKEGEAFKRHLMARHGQAINVIGNKRGADTLDHGFLAD